MDGDDGTDSNQEACEQEHDPHSGAHRANESEGTRGIGTEARGNGAQSGARAVSKRVAEGERGAERRKRRSVRHKAGEMEPIEEREEE